MGWRNLSSKNSFIPDNPYPNAFDILESARRRWQPDNTEVPLVLDIDLDFFLNEVAYGQHAEDGRLSDAEFTPWPVSDFENFLKHNCGLKNCPDVPAYFIEHHHEAFHIWKELINRGALTIPFDVAHIDAHADFGLGDAAWYDIGRTLLKNAVELRPSHKLVKERLLPGNYLLFAVACRWIRNLYYIPHPSKASDFGRFGFYPEGPSPQFVRLEQYTDEPFMYEPKVIAVEPPVPLSIISWPAFHSRIRPNHVIFAQSPDYTPSTADELLERAKLLLKEAVL